MDISNISANPIWGYFNHLTQIPRPSKKEGKVIAYLLDFAASHKLEAMKDDAGNVLIKKPATSGYENRQTLILQSHVDMVCEKNTESLHNFDTDPIDTCIEGDWVKAKGTTLGADDGIGVAAALAILASQDVEHGPLECLFTVDEETGLSGAYALQPGFLSGNILVNLDSEEDGQFCIGCAGGKNTLGIFSFNPGEPPAGYYWFEVRISGLSGGHSGSEIHLGLGNANKILTRYLWTLGQRLPLYLAAIDGGNLSNAIPREASAIAGVPYSGKEKVRETLNILSADIEAELKKTDPHVSLTVETARQPEKCIDKSTSDNLLNALYCCPHGVMGMSHEIEGLVETSNNLASVKIKENNTIVVTTSQRSSTGSLKTDLVNMVRAVFTLAGAEIRETDGYPGWKPNPDSVILKVSGEVYRKLFEKDPEIIAIHAGLECGLFLEKYPGLDMISCGPTILGAHSPEERLQISTVEKWWTFLLGLLKKIPVK